MCENPKNIATNWFTKNNYTRKREMTVDVTILDNSCSVDEGDITLFPLAHLNLLNILTLRPQKAKGLLKMINVLLA